MKEKIKIFARKYPILLGTYRGLRYSLTKGRVRQLYHRLTAGHLLRKGKVSRFLGSSGPKYLQVGGGHHIKRGKEWLNGDIIAGEIYLDATKRLPFPDDSLDAIFTEQFIEHLPQRGAADFLREAYRTLKPGGTIRQSTPDLEKLLHVYYDKSDLVSRSDAIERHMRLHRHGATLEKATGCQLLNDIFRLWGHQFIYDRLALDTLTEEVGFQRLRWVSFGESTLDHLSGLERHATEEWMKDGITMICEADKLTNCDASQ